MYLPRLYVSWQLQTYYGVSMNYKINWRQNYPSWALHANKLLELRVELSGYKEANEVIAKIKAL